MSERILIVDDRPENLLALETLLRPSGAQVLQAASGVEALELLLEHPVAVALIDVEMPGMDGYELARMMSESPRTRDIPVIFVTAGGADVQRLYKAYDLGAVDFLAKPLEPKFVQSKVGTFLRLHRQAKELAETQRRLAAVMEAAPVGITFCSDRFGHTLSRNRAAQDQRSGIEAFEEAKAANDVAEALLWQALNTGTTVRQADVELLLADGERRVLDCIASPIDAGGGRDRGGVLISIDVTERTRLEHALRSSEARFRALAEAMPQLVWTATDDGIIDYVNTRAASYQPQAEPLANRRVWQLPVVSEDRERTQAAWHAAKALEADYSCEHRISMADGSVRWHISRARAVREARAVMWYGTSTDIHDLKMAEQGLRRNAAIRDQVMSVVAHDLRNPLMVVASNITLLRNMVLELPAEKGTRADASLSRVERQLKAMTRLVKELLDAGRLQAGEPLRLERAEHDLVSIVREVAQDFSALERRPIDIDCAMTRLPGYWDRERLERVLGNLVSNALKYSAPETPVSLKIEVVEGCAVVSVSDQGVGFSAEEQERIFQWFTRGSNVQATTPGTGIGLAAARRIAELHGGSLTARSELGVGSTFTLRLPLQAQRSDASLAASPAAGCS